MTPRSAKSSSRSRLWPRVARLTVLGVFGMALSVTVLLSLYLASTIAWPIHRLADAAERVRRAKGRQVKIPDLSRRKDEIGDLGRRMNDMIVGLAERFQLSLEIGAFLAGVSLAQLPFNQDLRRRIHPLMSFFIAVFFVTLPLATWAVYAGPLPSAMRDRHR